MFLVKLLQQWHFVLLQQWLNGDFSIAAAIFGTIAAAIAAAIFAAAIAKQEVLIIRRKIFLWEVQVRGFLSFVGKP